MLPSMLSLDAAQTAPTVALSAQIVKSKTKVDRQAFEADAELVGGHHEFWSLGLCCRLTDVKSLNCWGQDLTDVTILCEMPNVEVLSLSVNRISTLKYVINTSLCCHVMHVYTYMVAEFSDMLRRVCACSGISHSASSFRSFISEKMRYCAVSIVVLQSIRESTPGMTQVADMTEVQWLAKLPDLRVLWLSDNPCAETPNYRHKVRHNQCYLGVTCRHPLSRSHTWNRPGATPFAQAHQARQ